MPFAAKAHVLLPVSLLAMLVSAPEGRAQQTQKSADECVGLVCTLQRRQQEGAVAAPQVQQPREPCVGILCTLTGENTEPGGQTAQAGDGLAVPQTGLFGAIFSGGERPQPAPSTPAEPAPPADEAAPAAGAAAAQALPAFNGSAESEVISEGMGANATAPSPGHRCVQKTNDPWECTRR